jgi:hypothetical protein
MREPLLRSSSQIDEQLISYAMLLSYEQLQAALIEVKNAACPHGIDWRILQEVLLLSDRHSS